MQFAVLPHPKSHTRRENGQLVGRYRRLLSFSLASARLNRAYQEIKPTMDGNLRWNCPETESWPASGCRPSKCDCRDVLFQTSALEVTSVHLSALTWDGSANSGIQLLGMHRDYELRTGQLSTISHFRRVRRFSLQSFLFRKFFKSTASSYPLLKQAVCQAIFLEDWRYGPLNTWLFDEELSVICSGRLLVPDANPWSIISGRYIASLVDQPSLNFPRWATGIWPAAWGRNLSLLVPKSGTNDVITGQYYSHFGYCAGEPSCDIRRHYLLFFFTHPPKVT